MTIVDKTGALATLLCRDRVCIELGCGARKRLKEAIGIDLLDYGDVDIVGDVFDVLAAFPNCSVDDVYSSHFFEHVDDLPRLLSELGRVVKPNGTVKVVVPHFSNPYFYSDTTHKTAFGLYSLSYFAEDRILTRRVPTYQRAIQFSVENVQLVFKSARPWYGRHAFKKVVGAIVNSSTYTMELYEEFFCYLVPCYEVCYELRRAAV